MQSLTTLAVDPSERIIDSPAGMIIPMTPDKISSDATPTEKGKAQVSKTIRLWSEFLRRHCTIVEKIEAVGGWPSDIAAAASGVKRLFLVEFYSLFLTTASVLGFKEAAINFPTPTDLVGKLLTSLKEDILTTVIRLIENASPSITVSKTEAA